MSNHIGISQGVWNSNQIGSLETGFSNSESSFSGGRYSSSYTKDYPFYKRGLNMRSVRGSLGINYTEYVKRMQLVNKYVKQGLTIPQINNFHEKFKKRGGGSLQQFDSFIPDQRLIADAQEREEAELLARLKEEEKKKAISDSNLFPPDEELNPTDPLTDDELKSNNNTKPIVTPKKSNLLIYGVIGVVALVGIIILVKRK